MDVNWGAAAKNFVADEVEKRGEIKKGTPPLTLSEVDAIFDAYDLDGNGKLEPEELVAMIKDMKHTDKEIDVQKVISVWDPSGDWCVDRDEFHARLEEIAGKDKVADVWLHNLRTGALALWHQKNQMTKNQKGNMESWQIGSEEKASAEAMRKEALKQSKMSAAASEATIVKVAGEVFDTYDKDKSGVLDAAEVAIILKNMAVDDTEVLTKEMNDAYKSAFTKMGERFVTRQEFINEITQMQDRTGFALMLARMRGKSSLAKARDTVFKAVFANTGPNLPVTEFFVKRKFTAMVVSTMAILFALSAKRSVLN